MDLQVTFDLKTAATMLTILILLATAVGKLFVMDYRIGIVEAHITEIKADVRLILGRSVFDWTVPAKQSTKEGQ